MPFLGFLTEESPVVTRAVWIISPSGGHGMGQECRDGFSSVPLPNGTPGPELGGGSFQPCQTVSGLVSESVSSL